MPRKARKKSESGIYHIIMRGINRQNIFEDDEDYINFINVIGLYKSECGYELYAYCLMGNHVHILMKVGAKPLEVVMRKICARYVYFYNKKYERIGNLFQDRFKSEPVDNEAYFLTVMRYIHQNPVKAGLAKKIEQYRWSSYIQYINAPKLVDIDFALNIFDDDRGKALKKFIQYNNEINKDICLEIEERHRITDEGARKIITNICNIKNAVDLQKLETSKRNVYLNELREKYGLSIRQIERLTGINRGIISRI